MEPRRETRPGLDEMIEQLMAAGCTDLAVLEPDWVAGTSPRGNRITLSWDEERSALTLIRYLIRRDGSTMVGRFRLLATAARTAATL